MFRFFFSREAILSAPDGSAPRFVVAFEQLHVVAQQGRLPDRALTTEEMALVRAVVANLAADVKKADVVSNHIVYKIFPLDSTKAAAVERRLMGP